MTDPSAGFNKPPLKNNESRPKNIVITLDDLPPEEPAPRQYPGMPYSTGVVGEKKAGLTGLGASAVKQNLIAGLLGGVLAWALSELLFGESAHASSNSLLVSVGLWGAVLGMAMGGVLGCAEGITSKVNEKALSGGAIGAAIGFIGGFVGGILGQFIYSALGGGANAISPGEQILARTLGWALLGMFIGIAQGASGKALKKVVNALIGGLLGGAAGGLAFDFLGGIANTVVISRLFGIAILGGLTGAAIGMVEEARKEAWLKVVQGPQSGKQFIIYDTVTRIGSFVKCEIVLIKDPYVQAEHCRILGRANNYYLECHPGAAVLINGAPAASSIRLKRGDILGIGQSLLMYEDKAVAVHAIGGIAK